MYIAFKGKLYKYKGYSTSKPELEKEYKTLADIPTWLSGKVFIRETDLPDGCYRERKGKLVKIPDRWIDSVSTRQTMRKRNPVSRRTRKEK